MIYPTASDILRCVERNLAAISDDDTPRTAIKSTLATSRHLLRHVDLRLKLEKPILLDDIDKASELLGKVATYLAAQGRDRKSVV